MNGRSTRAYARYFEGYTEVDYKVNGKIRTKRVYTASYLKPDLTPKGRVRQKLLTACLYALTVLLFFAAGLTKSGANRIWYVNAPTAFGLITLLYLTSSVFTNVFAGENMILRTYRSASEALMLRAKRAAIAMAASAGLSLVYLFTHLKENLRLMGRGVLLFLLGAASAYLLYRLESGVTYVEVPNNALVPVEEDQISIANF